MLQNENIVCLGNMHWAGHMTSKQQIMSRLAEQNRILYVNRPLTFLSPFSGNEEIPAQRQFKEMLQGPHEIRPNLFVATPPLCMPLRFWGPSYVLNTRILSIWLKRIIRLLGMESPIVWTYLPESTKIVKNLPKKLSVYHCVDEHSEWGVWWNSIESVRDSEIELLKEVDLVVTTAEYLSKNKRRYNSNCYFVPNAVDYELFHTATEPSTQIPKELLKMPRPVIGYVGMLRSIVDFSLLEYLARNRPDWTFVIIGGRMDSRIDLSRLKGAANVKILGNRRVEELPRYLKGIDVCLIPYVLNNLSLGTFPLKLFEYLAAGKAVVSTALPSLETYRNVIRLARGKEEFLLAIDNSLAETGEEFSEQREAVARGNTWDVRVEEISRLIQETIKKRQENILEQIKN